MSDEAADREHPTAEKLSAYQANVLSPEQDDAIQEHVASCSLCVERLLDLQRFLEFVPEQPRKGVADLEAAAQWGKLRERIEKDRAGSQDRMTPEGGRWRRVLGSPRTAYGLAAVLALGLVGLAMYTLKLRQELHGPEMSSRVVLLSSLTLARGSEDQVKTVDLARHEEVKITFGLEAPRRASFPRYRLEVKDARDRVILASDDLRKQDESFAFTLPTERLPTGRYVIEVRGLQGAGRPPELVGRYELKIRRL